MAVALLVNGGLMLLRASGDVIKMDGDGLEYMSIVYRRLG